MGRRPTLNVMGTGGHQKSNVGGGGLEKTSGPPPIVILNGTALSISLISLQSEHFLIFNYPTTGE